MYINVWPSLSTTWNFVENTGTLTTYTQGGQTLKGYIVGDGIHYKGKEKVHRGKRKFQV